MLTYIHMVHFESKSETFRMPDCKMFEQFRAWLQGRDGNAGYFFELEGTERLVNFRNVCYMTVHKLEEPDIIKSSGSSARLSSITPPGQPPSRPSPYGR